MPVTRSSRLLALSAVGVLLVAAACTGGGDDDDASPDITDPPEQTPSVETIADFQLVGIIDEAFAGQDPPVDVDPTDLDVASTPDPAGTPGTSPGTTPAGTPVGTTPTRGGIIRLTIEDLSEDLQEACGLGPDSVVHVYWTTSTAFEPGDVLDDVEDEIEDRTVAMSGAILRIDDGGDGDLSTPQSTTESTPSGTTTPFDVGSPSATGSPSTSVEASDCLLVAQQIGFGTTALPTPRPRTGTRATTAPTPARTASPTPRATATPEDTDPPTASPEDTEDPTDSPDPSP